MLSEHLAQTYGIDVAGLSAMDRGVYRVDRHDGPAWVARVFATRDRAAVEGDDEVLRALERGGFPAERPAGPVSVMDGQPVMVTSYVAGERAPGRARTYAILGALLGRLHARPATNIRPGGAWHHLCPQGTPRDEIGAVLALLPDSRLRSTVEQLDDCADLPHAFVHPDFVPANAIATADDSLVIVDWAGSGRGPRLWSLGFLLWAAGAADLRLVDWAASRYARHVCLEPAELDRLPAAIGARGLTISCWLVSHRHRKPEQVLAELPKDRELAEAIAARAIQAMAEAPDARRS
jgi:Ser/Thr protein kinase RdoA (MazF antagonist)